MFFRLSARPLWRAVRVVKPVLILEGRELPCRRDFDQTFVSATRRLFDELLEIRAVHVHRLAEDGTALVDIGKELQNQMRRYGGSVSEIVISVSEVIGGVVNSAFVFGSSAYDADAIPRFVENWAAGKPAFDARGNQQEFRSGEHFEGRGRDGAEAGGQSRRGCQRRRDRRFLCRQGSKESGMSG